LRLGVALCTALPVMACGSTAANHPTTDAGLQQTGIANGPGAATGNGLGASVAPGAGGSGGTVGLGGTTGATVSGSTTGGPGGRTGGTTGAGTSGSATGGTTGPAVTEAALGPGITATTIYVGAAYFPDAANANTALGAAGANSGDQRDYYNAVIDDLNKRGGVLGRKMVPVYAEYKAASTDSLDAQSESACNTWTKDHKVFVLMFRGRVLQECARKAGTLITGGTGETGPVFAKLPNLIDPGEVRLERLGQATVSGLDRQQYFKTTTEWPSGKVGVITWDNASYRYGVTNGYLAALRRLGKTAATAFIAEPQTAGSISDSSAAVSNAVLKFRSAGIDHVFIQDGPAGVFGLGGLTLLFLQNAKSQSYHPRYGFNANNVPGYSIYPADQQHGMLAVDFSDYMPQQDAGIAANPARTRCFAIMAKYGVTANDQNTEATAAGSCQDIWFIETLLRRASQPTLQGAIAAAESLGTSFQSPLAYGTRLGPGRHDGAELARTAMYDDACSCMKYTSRPYAP
ncbi:MAG: branched-chain amino acid transport system substrate-binding protein, partial [Actinomycetota bacterium]|nr:branched-chain amino acid transport system substrate-binding protein [Actinomycetota bacterium]